MIEKALEVVKASTHNLKRIDCRIPHGQVTLVTGPSGSGKSSLAFDTVYAEAQRRFVESMSTYTRQFLEKMERPPVEEMRGILPAIALEARTSVKNARSTVGTLTEVHDVLRLLFSHIGSVECSQGHGPLVASSPPEIAERLCSANGGEQLTLLAAMDRPPKNADAKLRELIRQGYFRILDKDELVRLEPEARWLKRRDPLMVVLGRFHASLENQARIAATAEEAFKLSGGRLEVLGGGLRYFSERLTCPLCAESAARPVPALFSFNSPLGACKECQGFGRIMGIDHDRVFPDKRKTLRERPIAVWNSPAYEDLYPRLFKACGVAGIPLDRPWEELDGDQRDFVWSGRGSFKNLDSFFARLEKRNYRMHVRVLLARYRAYEECPACDGYRLSPDALRVRVKGRNLAEISRWSIEETTRWFAEQRWAKAERQIADHLLRQLLVRLETLCRVGLDYLSLDRQARTLSGGEAQRIQLASALGSGLTTTLYVLDEPTIGLHPKDSEKLLALLRDLAAQGNTVLVVEHDRTLIRGADHVIDLGPRAGVHGGEVVAEGSLSEILKTPASLTGAYLRGDFTKRRVAHRVYSPAELRAQPRVGVVGASENNLLNVDVEFPLGCLVAVTGVSGSGKSTLVQKILHDNFQRSRGVVDVEPGRCEKLTGVDILDDMILVDQRPLGRSSRSNPVTYLKVYDEIRKLYAATERARRGGISAGHFSFNVPQGRCPECEGKGQQEVDMHFMAPVRVTCDRCLGKRFRPEVLEVTFRGLSIAETLELTVDSAIEHFQERAKLCRKLRLLVDVGLGYLQLGQSTATLSGGEAQRLKLATFLGGRRLEGSRPRLFLFDEPTTGLHMADIDLLHDTFRRLIERGDAVVVVEHSLDLVARADWIVDLGPGGGPHGGRLLFSGPRTEFLDVAEGPTASELRRHIEEEWDPSRLEDAEARSGHQSSA